MDAETNHSKSTLQRFFRQSKACNFAGQKMWHSCRGEGRENARKKTPKMWVREAPACTVKNVFLCELSCVEKSHSNVLFIVCTINDNVRVKYDLVFRLKYLKCVLILRP